MMEDCHWLDAASWDLLNQVHQELPETALLLTTRPTVGERHEVLEALIAAPDVDLLRLERIPADAARRLASDRFGVIDLPEGLAGLIEAKAEGHPLFIEELVYSLRDQGYVEVVDGKVATAVPGERLENLDLPDTVHGLTSSRLSRLSAIEQTTVKVASVLGVSFDAELLAAIHPLSLDEGVIAEQLDDLVRRDLITPTDNGFTFRHAVVQESAYEQLPLAMRRQLHEEVAKRIEEGGPAPTQYPRTRPPLGGCRPPGTGSRLPRGRRSGRTRSGCLRRRRFFSGRRPGQSGSTRCSWQQPSRDALRIHPPVTRGSRGSTGPPRPGGGAVPGGPGQAGPRRVWGLGQGDRPFHQGSVRPDRPSARRSAQPGRPGRRHATGRLHPLGLSVRSTTSRPTCPAGW